MQAADPSSVASHDFSPAVPLPWHAERDETLRCVQVRDETADVRTFVFAAEGARHFRYLPGQFVTFELEIGGRRINRCYTLASTPTRPDRVAISVKRVPGGVVSNWLHENLRPGMVLGAMGPAGSFSCFLAPAPRYLFISGGSGITPLMSMLRALHDLASDADVVFVHCARTPADVVFADELALLARTMKHLRVAIVCDGQPPGSAYSGHIGRLDAVRLGHIAADFRERDVYVCGPAPFMGAVRGALAESAFDMGRYHQESFSFETRATAALGETLDEPAALDPAGSAVATFRVMLAKTQREFACRADQSILQAATEAGLRLPFSCSQGICGTCKTRKVSGSVDMKHGGGIRPREIEQGWVLLCCSRPLEDVVMDR